MGGDWDHSLWPIFFGICRGRRQVLGCIAEREEVDVHLSREAFGQIGWGDPAGEGDQIV